MTQRTRFSYTDADSSRPGSNLMPYVPILLSNDRTSADVSALLDTGATINVLPYPVGIQLGFVWAQQTVAVQLSGKLSQSPARAVVITGTITGYAPVRLAFAWTQLAMVPVILGQINFFLEYDVCFFRSQSVFELQPKVK